MKKPIPARSIRPVLAGCLGAVVILFAWPTLSFLHDQQPTLPLRAAFYYPWFPETWRNATIDPYTVYSPSLGAYNSSDTTVIRQHIAAMRYGHIAAGIVSWWGTGTSTDSRIPAILAATAGSPFRWAIYYEREGYEDPSASTLAADLAYVRDRYGHDPSYLRINGRFVVFVYADSSDGCDMAERWKQAQSTINAYIVLKVFGGYRSCASQPDGWHQYAPAKPADRQGRYSYTISPGFHKAGEAPRLERDLSRWRRNIRDMIASGARFQLITTFNEWGEGTAVESAAEWVSPSGYGLYLDALHDNGAPLTAPKP